MSVVAKQKEATELFYNGHESWGHGGDASFCGQATLADLSKIFFDLVTPS